MTRTRAHHVFGAIGLAAAMGVGAQAQDSGGAIPLEPELAGRPQVECVMLEQIETRSTWLGNPWPGGIVPYQFDANTTASMQAAMCEAMDELHTVCDVTFVPRTGEANYLNIRNSTGNNSFVGMIGGGQTVNIYNWNFKYIMCHELMHALGLKHEQARPDRDTFVSISSANICQTCCSGGPCDHNFAISPNAATPGAYDFESVMHYGQNAFSTNGQPTILCLPPYTQYQTVIGNRSYLSQGDKDGLMWRYGAAVDDALEPNETLATAAAVDPAERVKALHLTDRDDYFRVVLPAGTRTVSLTGWNRGVVESGRVYVATLSGSLLGSAPLAAGGEGGVTTAEVTLLLSGGEYVVRVGRGCGQGGAYTLALPPLCPADFNRSGQVSVQDIFDFLEGYFANDPGADFNGQAGISVQDIFDFLAAYFGDCP